MVSRRLPTFNGSSMLADLVLFSSSGLFIFREGLYWRTFAPCFMPYARISLATCLFNITQPPRSTFYLLLFQYADDSLFLYSQHELMMLIFRESRFLLSWLPRMECTSLCSMELIYFVFHNTDSCMTFITPSYPFALEMIP